MDHPYSPNSTIEILDERVAEQYYLNLDSPLSFLQQPPPIPCSTASTSSFRNNSVYSYQLETETNHQPVFSNSNAFGSMVSLPDSGVYSNNFIYNATDYELDNPSIDSLPDYGSHYHSNATFPSFHSSAMSNFDNNPVYPPYTPTINDSFTPSMSDSAFTPNSTFNNEDTRAPVPSASLKMSPVFNSMTPGKVYKKHSTARLNSYSAIQTHTSNHTIAFPAPVNVSGGQAEGVSPLYHKYKHELENTPISVRSTTSSTSTDNLPQMTTFRHNSDSSSSSYLSETVVPSRNEAIGVNKPRLNKKLSHRSLAEDQIEVDKKTKKHTRRRLLPRSKNGCWICRIKHLKCDETRPVCTSCARFGIDCDYSPKKPDYVTDKELRRQKLMLVTEVRKAATQRPKARPKCRAKQELDP